MRVARDIAARLRIGGALANTAWLMGERAASVLVTLAVGIVLARTLGVAEFGAFGYLTSIIALVTPFTAAGLNAVATQEFVEGRKPEHAVFGTVSLLRFAIGLAAAVGLLVLDQAVGLSNGLGLWLLLLALANTFTCFQVVDLWLQAQVRSKFAAATRLTVLCSFAALKVLAITLGNATLTDLLLIQAVEVAVSGLAFCVLYRALGGRISLWRYEKDLSIKLLSRSGWLIASGVLEAINLKIDQVMLGWMSGFEQVGYYSVAARLSEAWYVVPAIVASSYFPALVRNKAANQGAYYKSMQRLLIALAALAVFLSVMVTALAPSVISVLYGEAFAPSATILMIHTWASVFIFVRAVLSKWLIIENALKYSLATHACGALANVLLNLFMIPAYGGVGAAIATVLSYAIASYFSLFLFRATRPFGLFVTRSLVLSPQLLMAKLKQS